MFSLLQIKGKIRTGKNIRYNDVGSFFKVYISFTKTKRAQTYLRRCIHVIIYLYFENACWSIYFV